MSGPRHHRALGVFLVNGYVQHPDDACQVFDFAMATDSFSSVVLDPGLIAAAADAPGQLLDGTISIPVGCLADVNSDGAVSPADFTVWIAASNAKAPECDQNGDGSCTPADYTAWMANFSDGAVNLERMLIWNRSQRPSRGLWLQQKVKAKPTRFWPDLGLFSKVRRILRRAV